jgi:hypothetical protein
MISIKLQEYLYYLLNKLPYDVYDSVPKDAKCPYIQIGASYGNDNSTKTGFAYNDYQTIDIFSDYKGKKEVRGIIQQVNNLLQNKEFIFDDMQVSLYLDTNKILEQNDTEGKYYHGILIYKINTQIK